MAFPAKVSEVHEAQLQFQFLMNVNKGHSMLCNALVADIGEDSNIDTLGRVVSSVTASRFRVSRSHPLAPVL